MSAEFNAVQHSEGVSRCLVEALRLLEEAGACWTTGDRAGFSRLMAQARMQTVFAASNADQCTYWERVALSEVERGAAA